MMMMMMRWGIFGSTVMRYCNILGYGNGKSQVVFLIHPLARDVGR